MVIYKQRHVRVKITISVVNIVYFLELEPLTLALAVIGKMGSAAAFGTVYVYSMELYPTVVRTSGLGAGSCVARFGSMAAPYIAQAVCSHILGLCTCNRFPFNI